MPQGFPVPTPNPIESSEGTGGASSSLSLHDRGVIYDSFDRVTSGDIGGTETHRRSWENQVEFETDGDGLIKIGAGYGIQVFDAHSQFGQLKTKIIEDAATAEWWVVFRQQDSQNYWRVGVQNGQYMAQVIIGNALGTIASSFTVNAAPTPADGDEVEVWLWSDDGIDVYINGVHIWTIGDVQLMDERKVGVACNGRGAKWDYVSFAQ